MSIVLPGCECLTAGAQCRAIAPRRRYGSALFPKTKLPWPQRQRQIDLASVSAIDRAEYSLAGNIGDGSRRHDLLYHNIAVYRGTSQSQLEACNPDLASNADCSDLGAPSDCSRRWQLVHCNAVQFMCCASTHSRLGQGLVERKNRFEA